MSTPDSEPDLDDKVGYILEAQRVYTELGCPRELVELVDNPHHILFEECLDVKLNDKRAKSSACKVFIFEKYVVVATLKIESISSNGEAEVGNENSNLMERGDAILSNTNRLRWFTEIPYNTLEAHKRAEKDRKGLKRDKKRSSLLYRSGHAPSVPGVPGSALPIAIDSVAESDGASVGSGESSIDEEMLFRAQQRLEEEEERDAAKYEVKIFADLSKITPEFYSKEVDHGVFLTYVTSVPAEEFDLHKESAKFGVGKFKKSKNKKSMTELFQNGRVKNPVDIVVDRGELWIDDLTKAKQIFDIMKDQISVLIEKGSKTSDDDAPLIQNAPDSRAQSEPIVEKKSSSIHPADSIAKTKSGRSQSSSDIDESRRHRSIRASLYNLRKTLSPFGKGKARSAPAPELVGKPNPQMINASIEKKPSMRLSVGRSDNTKRNSTKLSAVSIGEVATADEGLEVEYTVVFKAARYGFEINSAKNFGSFTKRIDEHGLAKAAGVAMGDKIVTINTTSITETMLSQECTAILKVSTLPVRITFVRKQANELKRHRQLMNATLQSTESGFSVAGVEMRQGSVVAVDEHHDDENQRVPSKVGKADKKGSTSMFVEITDAKKQLPQETDSVAIDMTAEYDKKKSARERARRISSDEDMALLQAPRPKFEGTIERGKKIRRFAKKQQSVQKRRVFITNMNEFKMFKETANDFINAETNISSLFATMLKYVKEGDEKTCVHALQEIYITESKYIDDLGHLMGIKKMLRRRFRPMKCNEFRNGNLFCEHLRPVLLCKQTSSIRELAIPPHEVKSLFMNIKALVDINLEMFSRLQRSLVRRFKRLEAGNVVEVVDLLSAFAPTFIKLAPYLQGYVGYCQRYSQAALLEKDLRLKNPWYREAIVEYETLKKVSLPNLMIKPVQRITKYPLLFTTLSKYVNKLTTLKKGTSMKNITAAITSTMSRTNGKSKSSNMPDELDEIVEKLNKATDMVSFVCDKVNGKVGEFENLQQLAVAFKEIGGKTSNKVDELIAPFRRFIKVLDGIGYEDCTKEECVDATRLYLFNDMLVFACEPGQRSYSRAGSTSDTRFSLARKTAAKLGYKVSEKDSSSEKKRSLPKSVGSGEKKKSLGKGSNGPNKYDTVRSALRGTLAKTSKKTSGGPSSDGPEYDVIRAVKLREISRLSKIEVQEPTSENEKVRYIISFYCSTKHKGTENTIAQIKFYLDTEELREDIYQIIEKFSAEVRSKRENMLEMQQIIQQKKMKKRRFAKKAKHGEMST